MGFSVWLSNKSVKSALLSRDFPSSLFYIEKLHSLLDALPLNTRENLPFFEWSDEDAMRAKRGKAERNEYIKWLCCVWLLIKSCTSCTYSMRSLIRFFSSKPCTFYFKIWEQFEMFRKFRSTYQTYIWIFFLKTLYILLPNLGAV